MVKAIVVALVCVASVARAESPKLVEARHAVAAVDYGAAQRLLVEALHDGTNTPSELREIYRLSARAAIVLGQRDVGEQYYRRWLAIDPGASLPEDTAPKLREPFVAAQAYIAAQGRFAARIDRGETFVYAVVTSDPLAMARGALAIGATAASPLDAEHRAAIDGTARRAAVVDEYGNHLVELDVPEPPIVERPLDRDPRAVAAPHDTAPVPRPWTRRWITWAIPTGICGALVIGFGSAALAENTSASQIAQDSSTHYYREVTDSVHKARVFAGITAVAGAGMIGFAIPMTIYFFQQRAEQHTIVVPTGTGVAVVGRF